MLRLFGFISVLAVALALPLAKGAEGDKCDLKHVQSGLWCEHCKAILDNDTTLEGKFCMKCCKDKPANERVEAKKVKVCVKTCYECAADGTHSWTPAKCDKCGKEMAKVVDKALVTFKCQGCGKEADKPGPCDNADCKAKKRMILESCAKSGTYPHVAEK